LTSANLCYNIKVPVPSAGLQYYGYLSADDNNGSSLAASLHNALFKFTKNSDGTFSIYLTSKVLDKLVISLFKISFTYYSENICKSKQILTNQQHILHYLPATHRNLCYFMITSNRIHSPEFWWTSIHWQMASFCQRMWVINRVVLWQIHGRHRQTNFCSSQCQWRSALFL
jgi:hypothetical protein